MMIKEIMYSGITSSPSDYESPDGELAVMMNGLKEEQAVKALFPPRTVFALESGQEVYFVHVTSDYKHFIVIDEQKTIWWRTESNEQLVHIHDFAQLEINEINAIGNTLIILCNDGVHYFLWKGNDNNYKDLGIGIPECPLSFGLSGGYGYYSKIFKRPYDPGTRPDRGDNYFNITFDKIELGDRGMPSRLRFSDANKVKITNQIMARVNELTAKIIKDGGFMFPFFVRYAFRLFDNSLSHHSAPVLMVPATNANPYALIMNKEFPSVISSLDMDILAYFGYLDYSPASFPALENLTQWKDVISSIDIFVSAPIYTYDQSGECWGFSNMSLSESFFAGENITNGPVGNDGRYLIYKHNTPHPEQSVVDLPRFEDDKLYEKIADCQSFYLYKSLSIDDIVNEWRTIDVSDATQRKRLLVEEDYLSTIVNKEVMTDDYQSHDTLIAQSSYNYNSRISLIDVSRSLYKGFNTETLVTFINEHPSGLGKRIHSIRTRIDTNQDPIVVENESAKELDDGFGMYLYYPDPNAKEMYISDGTHTMVANLKRHTGLNGSFYFDGFKTPPTTTSLRPSVSGSKTIPLHNKIYISEVNNPFYFPVSGIKTIGTGRIFGIRAAVKALSEGQWGYFPLYAFASDGVWSLEVKEDGTLRPAQPVTLDVCINRMSIAQVNDTVLFSTGRGMMMLSGAQSVCISEVLNNDSYQLDALPMIKKIFSRTDADISILPTTSFRKFILDSQIAFDYERQRIVIFSPTRKYAYVFSLKSKTWGMMSSNFKRYINCYPDSYVMTNDNRLVDLSSDLTEAADSTPAPAAGVMLAGINTILLTRPLKLDASDLLKSVSSVIQRGIFKKGKVSQVIYGSRDLKNWFPLASSTDQYLRDFVASPYKYFRILLLASLDENEYLSGCSVQFEPKYINKPR